MSVLFVIHDLYQEDNHFPINIGYLSAVLFKHGFNVDIYCMDIYHQTNDELAHYLYWNSYDLIGISFLAGRFTETIKPLCKIINKHKKDAWLVLGGHGPSPIPTFMLQETNADVIAIGEAEETIIDLINAKLSDGDLSKVKGIAYFEELKGSKGLSKKKINEKRKPITDLDSIPFPEWNLFPMERYSTCLKYPGMDDNDKLFPILTSRGCINKCSFCYRMQKGIRSRSIKNVVEEIILLKKRYGITYFNIYDELFGYPKKRIFDFYDELEKNDMNIKYFCAIRVDSIDKETLQTLKDSGCKFLNFGLESSNQKVLDLMCKHTTVEQNIEAIKLSKAIGIDIGLNFLWGNPGDTKKSLMDNIEIIKKYQDYTQLRTIRPVTPYPGCELYYEAIKKDLLKGSKDFFEKFKNSDLITVNFTEYSLNKCYKLLFDANRSLIFDYYGNLYNRYGDHFGFDTKNRDRLIKDFYELYFNKKTDFRGARHYGKN